MEGCTLMDEMFHDFKCGSQNGVGPNACCQLSLPRAHRNLTFRFSTVSFPHFVLFICLFSLSVHPVCMCVQDGQRLVTPVSSSSTFHSNTGHALAVVCLPVLRVASLYLPSNITVSWCLSVQTVVCCCEMRKCTHTLMPCRRFTLLRMFKDLSAEDGLAQNQLLYTLIGHCAGVVQQLCFDWS